MFKNKKDSLVDAVKYVMAESNVYRQVEEAVNNHFGVSSRKAVPHEHLAEYDALLAEAYKHAMEEGNIKHPNQQKLDVHEPEKDELTSMDFKMLRAGAKNKKIEEKLTKDMSAGDIITDFMNSKSENLKGKSNKERQKMALGAYYGMHPEKSRKKMDKSVESILEEIRSNLEEQLVDAYESGNAQIFENFVLSLTEEQREILGLNEFFDAIASSHLGRTLGAAGRAIGNVFSPAKSARNTGVQPAAPGGSPTPQASSAAPGGSPTPQASSAAPGGSPTPQASSAAPWRDQLVARSTGTRDFSMDRERRAAERQQAVDNADAQDGRELRAAARPQQPADTPQFSRKPPDTPQFSRKPPDTPQFSRKPPVTPPSSGITATTSQQPADRQQQPAARPAPRPARPAPRPARPAPRPARPTRQTELPDWKQSLVDTGGFTFNESTQIRESLESFLRNRFLKG